MLRNILYIYTCVLTVDSFVSYAGERWDFIIEATSGVGNYWMRFKGLMDCDERFNKVFELAILHYEGADHQEPHNEPTYDEMLHSGIVNIANLRPVKKNKKQLFMK